MDAGNEKAVARTGAGGAALGGRAIVAATTDRAFAFTRSQADKSANDIARDLFRQAVVDLFGGEDHIPDSVRTAMLRPLGTAKLREIQRENFDMIIEDYAEETRRQLGLKPKV